MFAPFVAVATLFALPALAAPTGSSGSCNTGDIQCCNSVEHVSLAFVLQVWFVLAAPGADARRAVELCRRLRPPGPPGHQLAGRHGPDRSPVLPAQRYRARR